MTYGSNLSASHTDWSVFGRLAADDENVAAQAKEQLARRYWPAIYAYCRALGHSAEASSDLTQGFICDVILAKKLLHIATPDRGRFRSLLLRSLQNYLRQNHRESRRRQVGLQPGQHAQDIDQTTSAPSDGQTPEAAFVSQWATTLVHQALETVRQQCYEDGLGEHWQVFEARVARPMLFGDAPTDHEILADRFDLESSSQAANMAITIKRRFVTTLRNEIAETLDDPHRVEDELLELLRGVKGQ